MMENTCLYREIHITYDARLPREIVHLLADEEIINFSQKDKTLKTISITLCNNDQEIEITSTPKSDIRRLRRITGYLSEVSNFNQAKRAEERDRYKHIDNNNF